MTAWVVFFVVYALLVFITAWFMEIYKKILRGTNTEVEENGKKVAKRVTKSKVWELWLVAAVPSYLLGWAFYYMVDPPVELHKGLIFVYGTFILILQKHVDMVLVKKIIDIVRALRNVWLRKMGVPEDEIDRLD